MHRSIRIICALTALLGAAPALAADIFGRVTDMSGRAVPGAVVTVHGPHGSEQAVTDDEGAYHVPDVPGGTYHVEIAAPGYRPARYSNINVRDEQRATIDAQLTAGGNVDTFDVD